MPCTEENQLFDVSQENELRQVPRERVEAKQKTHWLLLGAAEHQKAEQENGEGQGNGDDQKVLGVVPE